MKINRQILDNRKKDILAGILIALTVICTYARYFNLKYISNVDEYESIAVPMYLCGKQWINTSNFHGYGITVLMTPLVWLFRGIEENYWIFQLESLLIRILCSLITYYICKKDLKTSTKSAFIVAIVCNIGTLGITDSAGLSAMSEFGICLLTLVLLCCIFNLYDSSKISLSIGLMVAFLAYGILIHSRVLVLYFNCTFLLIISLIGKKIKCRNVLIIIFASVALYWIVNGFNDYVIDLIYSSNSGANTISGVVGYAKVGSLFSSEDLFNTIWLFKSLIESFVFYSYGIIVVFWIVNIVYIVQRIINRQMDKLGLMSCFGMMNFFLMNLMIAIKERNDMASGDYRWLTYTRYAMPFTWIIVVTGGVIILGRKITNKKISFICLILTMIMCKDFLINVASVLDRTGYGIGTSMFVRYYYAGEKLTDYFGRYTIVIVLCSIIYLICMNSKKYFGIMVVYVIMSVGVLNALYDHYIELEVNMEKKYGQAVEFVMNDLVDLSYENLYLQGDSIIDCKIFEARLSGTEFSKMNNEDYFAELGNSILILLSENILETYNQNLYWVQIGEKQYVLTANNELYKKILERYNT